MVGGGGNGKLVGQIFCISGYVGDMGDQYQARAELGTWYGYMRLGNNFQSRVIAKSGCLVITWELGIVVTL